MSVSEGRRPAASAIAALRIWGKDGLIPQFKQAAIGMLELAVDGSKLVGTGFENEHIVHTHVAVLGLEVLGPDPGRENGLEPWFSGETL